MQFLARLPLFVMMSGVSGAAMMVPAIHGAMSGQYQAARSFFYSGLLILVLCALVGLATSGQSQRRPAQAMLLVMLGLMVGLPVVLALPLALALPDTGLFNAWWEMVSCLTTTGASLYSPDLLTSPLHLWRCLVGWGGGLLVLVTAVSIFEPLRLGGFEIMSAPYGRREKFVELPQSDVPRNVSSHLSSPGFMLQMTDPRPRLLRAARAIFPIYAGLTLALWILMQATGEPPLSALAIAAGTLSTSGVSVGGAAAASASGLGGEICIAAFMILPLSRRFWPGGGELRASEKLRGDPELRMAAGIVLLSGLVLFLRHFLASPEELAGLADGSAMEMRLGEALSAAWGGLFNALSFLTTTGWNSVEWQAARNWSGLAAPGLMLAGLAIMGGGVATAAGGVKLLRVYALSRQVEFELQRIVHPANVSGGGHMARRLRREGAYLAFIFFMLFAASIILCVALISLGRIEFETATVLSIAAITNTGPLASTIPLIPPLDATAGIASAPWNGWSGLSVFSKCVTAGAMIAGRMETLAILALLSPEYWRR